MNALLLNDIHIGVTRSAGTTLQSRYDIKRYLQTMLKATIYQHPDKDLIINGDLFDGFEVEMHEVLELFFTLTDWLKDTKRRAKLVRGNHDIAKNSEKTSSFAFLCSLLQRMYPEQVDVYDKGLEQMYEHVWVIPHVVNQDLFDIELDKVVGIAVPGYLLLHANVDNEFAEQADHSLNVSDDVIERLIALGWTLVFAHEHQHKRLYRGNVVVLGNQWPSSIADCLTMGRAQADGKKYAHILSTEEDFINDTRKVTIAPVETWDAAADYAEMDWKELINTSARFIKVTGKASTEDAQDVIMTVARYRQKSQAFVITNAVQIAGVDNLDDLSTLSQEKLQSVDVLAALKEELDPAECAAVDQLLAKRTTK